MEMLSAALEEAKEGKSSADTPPKDSASKSEPDTQTT